MRYVMRSVQLVSHRIFERTLRSRLRPRACLPERRWYISISFFFLRKGDSDLTFSQHFTLWWKVSGWVEVKRRGRLLPRDSDLVSCPCGVVSRFLLRSLRRELRIAAVTIYSFYLMTSDQARLPAELKHITKQRKRN